MTDKSVALTAVAAVAIALPGAFFLGGAVVYGAWNYGVAGVVDVPPVRYWTACFLSLALQVVKGVLSRTP